jgi:methylated-DNA-protein-cysteine methyltransferase-like protein
MAETPKQQEAARQFVTRVNALVRACPPGHVTTYGWIARALGYPRGARMVGWIMSETPASADVPAHRVINSKGELSGSHAFGQKGRMRSLLEQEGIVFEDSGRVDLVRYGWDPSNDSVAPTTEQVLSNSTNASAEVSERLIRLLMDDPLSPFRLAAPPVDDDR